MIGGYAYSLQDIENGVLRANRKGVGKVFNSLGYEINLDSSRLQAFAGIKLNVTKIQQLFFEQAKIIVGKEEKAGTCCLPAFSSLFTLILKGLYMYFSRLWVVKRWNCVVKFGFSSSFLKGK